MNSPKHVDLATGAWKMPTSAKPNVQERPKRCYTCTSAIVQEIILDRLHLDRLHALDVRGPKQSKAQPLCADSAALRFSALRSLRTPAVWAQV